MRLHSVFIRFYKSFNFDYLRKLDADSGEKGITPMPWEFVNEKFIPHVKIGIDSQITTVVGANESGKSHLLSAIEKGIYGDTDKFSIDERDFCRYSDFFESVEEDHPNFPDFGFEWIDLSDEETKYLQEICPPKTNSEKLNYEHFYFFRSKESTVIYIPKIKSKIPSAQKPQRKKNTSKESDANSLKVGDTAETTTEISDKKFNYSEAQALEAFERYEVEEIKETFFPAVFRIYSNIALPDRVEIRELLGKRKDENDNFEMFDRERSFSYAENHSSIEALLAQLSNLSLDTNNMAHVGQSVISQASNILKQLGNNKRVLNPEERVAAIRAFNLVYDLMFTIAKLRKKDFENLNKDMKEAATGSAKALSNKINSALKNKLRFPRIWSQDKNFALRVEATEHELNFTINDRTERDYSFDERSGGLKHFLSYYIQYLTHTPSPGVSSEILLMDEPDAHLSGEAQQDLLKIFQMFADPNAPGKIKGRKPIQVIFVTHSPFLIDKNHAERVRALEKPAGNSGTQVLRGPTQNRYEPLRSAFGPFLGETTFLSQCNLMVEGQADQILIAGATNYLRNNVAKIPESDLLDLNKITIVPCGGATNVPYMVYLAKGRGEDKPAIIVLLDSDAEGNRAKAGLTKNGPHPDKKAVIAEEFILQLGDITQKEIHPDIDNEKSDQKPFIDLEDLVPLSLSINVVKRFLSTYFDISEEVLKNFTSEEVLKLKTSDRSYYSVLREMVNKISPANTYDIDKVPFSKTLIDMLPDLHSQSIKDTAVRKQLNEFASNSRAVLKRLRFMQTKAEEDAKEKNQRKKVQEKIDLFFSDYKNAGEVQRDVVSTLLKNLLSSLEGSPKERNYILSVISEIEESQKLLEDPTENVPDFDKLITDLTRIKFAKERVKTDKEIVASID